mgnify:FL=1
MKKLLLLGYGLIFLVNSIKAQNSISGYIVSLETAEPIANATVFLNNKYNLALENPDSLKVTSDSTGFYIITGIKTDTYIINTWTTYRVVDQLYAMVLTSDRIEMDSSITVDFIFSENAFKYRLDYRSRRQEAYRSKEAAKAFLQKEKARLRGKTRNSDTVARQAIYPRIYINSQKERLLTWYIKNISEIKGQ